jgi:hypothetical protein
MGQLEHVTSSTESCSAVTGANDRVMVGELKSFGAQGFLTQQQIS